MIDVKESPRPRTWRRRWRTQKRLKRGHKKTTLQIQKSTRGLLGRGQAQQPEQEKLQAADSRGFDIAGIYNYKRKRARRGSLRGS